MIESNFRKDLEQKIDLYVNGRLNEEQIDELWSELIQDDYYLDYTKSVANIKTIIDERKKAQTSAPIRSLRQYASYGIAAAIALIIGVIGVMNYTSSNQINGIAPLESMDYGGVRGANNDAASLNNEIIKQAIQLADNGEMEEAVVLLEEELVKIDSPALIAEVSLTLGSIQYNYGNYTASLQNFERVVSQNGIDKLTLEKGYWYLGNTYFQLDMLDEAESAFRQAYDLNGAYSRVTKSYLDALQSAE